MKPKPILLADPVYPKRLREIAGPPPYLYITGNLTNWQDEPAIAIVGSRHASKYGQEIAYQLAYDLALVGIIVVSGMAYGVDSCAHRGALDAKGKTIAVLGCGLDCPYPVGNDELRREIEKKGLVITEFDYGTGARPENFPMRNRIVSGLSWGVVIVEAARESGALITARLALEQNRQVFAVPGKITLPLSFGPNRLIKEGAKLVQGAEDIVVEFPQLQKIFMKQKVEIEKEKLYNLSEIEASVFALLSDEPVYIDELIRSSGHPAPQIAGILTELEIKGFVTVLTGGRVGKKSCHS